MRLLGGYFAFDAPDPVLVASVLPAVIHVRGTERLSTLVELVGDESIAERPGRELVLTRLVEVLLVEALRAAPGDDAPAGAAARPRRRAARACAPRAARPRRTTMDGAPARATAALSRSAFFERFTRIVGLPPMEYLLAWRMALAKDLLRRRELALAEIAERVGYGSASSFSTAFSRYVGQPPSRFASAA